MRLSRPHSGHTESQFQTDAARPAGHTCRTSNRGASTSSPPGRRVSPQRPSPIRRKTILRREQGCLQEISLRASDEVRSCSYRHIWSDTGSSLLPHPTADRRVVVYRGLSARRLRRSFCAHNVMLINYRGRYITGNCMLGSVPVGGRLTHLTRRSPAGRRDGE